jgi:hypothetical protein
MFLASTRPVSIRRSAYVPALHSLDRLLDQALSAPGVASATCRHAYELPQDIDASSSVAKLENGVLTLTLAKKQPVDTTTRLTIN